MAKFQERDAFYDLGCGRGQVVIQVVKETNVKKAIGIELCQRPYQAARQVANSQLSWDQLQKIDFWFGEFSETDEDKNFYYDASDATVVYHSLHETLDDIEYYESMLEKKRVRITLRICRWSVMNLNRIVRTKIAGFS